MGRELSQGEERRGGGGLGRWQQGDDEARKTKECGGGGGAERPNYRLGKWKASQRLAPTTAIMTAFIASRRPII
jgi:hypothetical protein